MTKFILIGIVTLLGISLIFGGITYFSYSNKEITLRNAIKAKQKDSEIIFDQTWKVISQKAQITEQYKNGFKEVFTDIMDARYDNTKGQRGALFNFVHEANPNFDVSLYKDLSAAVEEQRENFTRVQEELLGLGQEHDNLIDRQPAKFFLVMIGGVEHIKLNIVTSKKTEGVFKIGQENDIKVF